MNQKISVKKVIFQFSSNLYIKWNMLVYQKKKIVILLIDKNPKKIIEQNKRFMKLEGS